MFFKPIFTAIIYCYLIFLPAFSEAKEIIITNHKITMALNYGNKASITSLIVNGQTVINGTDGIFT